MSQKFVEKSWAMSPVYAEDARNGNSKFVESERVLSATYDAGRGEKIVAEKPPLKSRTNGTAPTTKTAKAVANGKKNGAADTSLAAGKKKIFTKGTHGFTVYRNRDKSVYSVRDLIVVLKRSEYIGRDNRTFF